MFAGLQPFAGHRVGDAGTDRRTHQRRHLRQRRIKPAQQREQTVAVIAVEKQQRQLWPAEMLEVARNGAGGRGAVLDLVLRGDTACGRAVTRHAKTDRMLIRQRVEQRPENLQRGPDVVRRHGCDP